MSCATGGADLRAGPLHELLSRDAESPAVTANAVKSRVGPCAFLKSAARQAQSVAAAEHVHFVDVPSGQRGSAARASAGDEAAITSSSVTSPWGSLSRSSREIADHLPLREERRRRPRRPPPARSRSSGRSLQSTRRSPRRARRYRRHPPAVALQRPTISAALWTRVEVGQPVGRTPRLPPSARKSAMALAVGIDSRWQDLFE